MNGNSIKVRGATPEDQEAVRDLLRNAGRGHFSIDVKLGNTEAELHQLVLAHRREEVVGLGWGKPFLPWLEGYFGFRVAHVTLVCDSGSRQTSGDCSAGLYAALERALSEDYVAAVAIVSARTGDEGRRLLLNEGYSPVAFAPFWLNHGNTNPVGEDAFFMLKYLVKGISGNIASNKTLYVPEEVRQVVEAVRNQLGLSRTILTRPDEKAMDTQLRKKGGSLDEFVESCEEWLKGEAEEKPYFPLVGKRPLVTVNLEEPKNCYRVIVGMRQRWLPIGVLPFAKELLLMTRVPKTGYMPFPHSNYSVGEGAEPLAEAVGNLYNMLVGGTLNNKLLAKIMGKF